ncbi:MULTISPECIES: DUF1643 domain-containing protein [Providencia]|uniref:DUF1643 domain-containing protein n=1 Tax=Providencia TaxID=586 RepID=UPI0032DAAE76
MEIKSAYISKDELYRYDLWRIWDNTKPSIMFIGLNPSYADHEINDNTITRCINFSRMWGYGGLCMCNLFAYRATKPTEMFKALDPIGSDNDAILLSHAEKVDKIVASWGNHGRFKGRSAEIKSLLSNKLYYLELNKTGEPKHPLYIHSETKLKKL